MQNKDYENKRRECWEEYKEENLDGEVQWQPVSRYDVFCAAFDRAYALGKQEKDAEETPISERLYEEEKGQLEGIYYYLKRAADKQENDSVSVAILFEVMERLEDMFGIDLLTNGHVKPTPKDADTVIQGWVARDKDNIPRLHYDKPERTSGGYWQGGFKSSYLPRNAFPDLTWDDDPIEVEIIIKRKKNGEIQ